MNLKEFVNAIATDLADKAKSGAVDVCYETALDTFIVGYRKFCVQFAKRYLDHKGTDHELLQAFREKFVHMVKLSMISIDEIDSYVSCKYVDKRGRVLEICMSAVVVEREIKREVKPTTKRRK